MATNGVLGRFTFTSEIERLPRSATGGGRRAETLIKADGLRVVLVTMHAGAALHEHGAHGPITIQELEGRVVVAIGDAEHELRSGSLIGVERGIRHAVRALEAAAFLLTIGGTGEAPPV